MSSQRIHQVLDPASLDARVAWHVLEEHAHAAAKSVGADQNS